MKYAFLLTVHTDYDQLKRLITVLKSLGDIIIHVDKKTDFDYYRKVRDLTNLEASMDGRVYLTNKRLNCAWGGILNVKYNAFCCQSALKLANMRGCFFCRG
jgi:hypothetical protein